MGKTQITGNQILNDTVARADLNVDVAGSAVIRKVIAGSGITMTYTGADSGTGDVTISASGGGGTGGGSTNLAINDATGSLAAKTTQSEANNTPTEGSSFNATVAQSEANNTPTEGSTAGLRGFGDTNTMPVDHSTATNTYMASSTWVAPNGVTSVLVKCWGAGAGGVGGTTTQSSCGGGGGAFAQKLIAVTPGATYTVTVGAGSAGAAANAVPTNGGDTWFGSVTTVIAKGGQAGTSSTSTGVGGSATASIGDITYSGGTAIAGQAVGNASGGGGGAGSQGNGGNSTVTGNNSAGGVGGTPDGGNGGISVSSSGNSGGAGFVPGGGGGGGSSNALGTPGSGGAGAGGQIKLIYTAS